MSIAAASIGIRRLLHWQSCGLKYVRPLFLKEMLKREIGSPLLQVWHFHKHYTQWCEKLIMYFFSLLLFLKTKNLAYEIIILCECACTLPFSTFEPNLVWKLWRLSLLSSFYFPTVSSNMVEAQSSEEAAYT